MNLKLKSFEQWDAPEENGREGRRGRLEFFSEKENQETQQPHPGEGNTPEKNPHCVTVVGNLSLYFPPFHFYLGKLVHDGQKKNMMNLLNRVD
ncbi:hypothetical protein GYH30_047407 [Glycine max]|nr:hypothetical protein GYH30_047407 [Glycine max]